MKDFTNVVKEVLDHGYVRLVDSMGGDLSIVRAARVSYNADWRTGSEEKSDERLINYLMKNHHTSPFEAVTLTFEVQAPIFVIRQWHRHRTQSYNEISARYTEMEELFYIPDPEIIGLQSSSNKQMRLFDENENKHEIVETIKYQCSQSFKTYKQLLENGCPRELARSVLPLNTYTRMFTTINLHNLFNFIKLRNHPHAQYEIQVYAKAMMDLVQQHVAPVAVKSFKEMNSFI